MEKTPTDTPTSRTTDFVRIKVYHLEMVFFKVAQEQTTRVFRSDPNTYSRAIAKKLSGGTSTNYHKVPREERLDSLNDFNGKVRSAKIRLKGQR